MTRGRPLTMTDDLSTLRPAAGRTRLDDPTVRAIDLVVDANGDLDVWYATRAGALEGRRGAMARFARRAGVELAECRVPSDGVVAVPGEEAVELCRAFCRREPLTVLAHLVHEERRIDRGGPAAGGARTASRARALVRSWTDGH